MSNPNPAPEMPPSMSASELRRRLLSTDPPAAISGPPVTETDAPAGLSTFGTSADSLAKLRMPPAPTESATTPMTTTAPPPKRSPVLGMKPNDQENSRFTAAPIVAEPPASEPAKTVMRDATPAHLQDIPQESSRGRSSSDENSDVKRYRRENRELRNLLSEMKQLLQEASDNEQRFAAREQELQVQLADRQRKVDDLSSQLQVIDEQIASGNLGPPTAPVVPKTRTELEEWSDELEKEANKLNQERRRLEDDRRQLRDDEDALERQMREMEVSMARERAMLARQETELKRLSAEIQHELEMLQRGDTTLREQMQKFQRRANDVMQGKVGGGGNPASPPAGRH